MTLLEKDHREELWERCFGELLDSTQARLQEAGCTRMSKIDALAGHLPEAELFKVYCEATSTSLATMVEEDYDVFRSLVLLGHRETKSLRERRAQATLGSRAVWTAQAATSARVQRDMEGSSDMVVMGLRVPRQPKSKKKRWASRGAKAKMNTSKDSRAQQEEAERQRWVLRLVKLLRDTSLPIVAKVRDSINPERALHRASGDARGSHIRNMVRAMENFMQWRGVNGNSSGPWPKQETEFTDYLETRASEPCGVTVPGSFLSAVSFLEEAGAVDMGNRFSESSMIKKTAKSIRKQLSSAAGVKERRKAELLLLAQIRSWELLVITTRPDVPRYFRAYAWARCVKVWTAMRFDCTRGLLPESLFWSKDAGLEGILGRSKTTGAGKKTEIRRFWISSEAWLATPEWLEVGFSIWKSEGFNFERDYLIPVPNSSYTGTVPRAAIYAEAAALSSSLWEFLRVPEVVDDRAEVVDEPPTIGRNP